MQAKGVETQRSTGSEGEREVRTGSVAAFDAFGLGSGLGRLGRLDASGLDQSLHQSGLLGVCHLRPGWYAGCKCMQDTWTLRRNVRQRLPEIQSDRLLSAASPARVHGVVHSTLSSRMESLLRPPW